MKPNERTVNFASDECVENKTPSQNMANVPGMEDATREGTER